MADKQRLIWLDNLKGFLILLVVLGHCIQHTTSEFETDILFRYIYSFHMPLFIFVSGFACYRTELKWNMISRRFVQLIIPFLTWSAIAALTARDYTVFTNDILHPEQGLWFLWALFFITVLHVISCRAAYKLHCPDEITSAVFAIILLGTMRKFDLFCYPTIAKFFMYYIIGFYARKYMDKFEVFEKGYIIISAVCLFFIAGFFSTQIGAPNFMPEGSSAFYGQIYNLVISFIAIFAFILLFKKYIYNKLYISALGGGMTLGVYAIHRPIMSLLPLQLISYDEKLTYYLLLIVLWIVVSILSYIAVWILDKNKYTALIFNGKRIKK